MATMLQDRPQIGSLPLTFGYYPSSGAIWRRVQGSGLQYRDLGLHGASHGLLGARLIRGDHAGSRSNWLPDDAEFYYLHVMAGSATLRTDQGQSVQLSTGDTLVMPPFTMDARAFEYSSGFEALEFTSSGSFEHIDRFRARHGLPTSDDLPAEAIVTRDEPESYITGDGPRSFFTYRDLGATLATGRRMHLHVVGIADRPPGGTGWHTHSMDQFFMPFTGWLDIWVEGLGKVRMERGDAMFIPAGIRHNVTDFTLDYTVVEVCIPTDYDTISAEDPDAG